MRLLSQVTFACLRFSDKSCSIQVLSKSSMWEHVCTYRAKYNMGVVYGTSEICDQNGERVSKNNKSFEKLFLGTDYANLW